ncbi:excisionase from transposon Tn916 [Oxobacter pfennigii]|uniref:Excisionase from transposon Tn916 n=1 Tax=Oxobacter pfennigii TaxID=36849 RepID=A0A0P8YTI7_9CLOT|nr:excisionase [Oxobacter pfennigii]KPU43009.1 excisionase from transposon Tn916 [Oxobacter pfennigii]
MDITSEQLKTIVSEAIREAAPQQPKLTMTILECSKYSGIGKDKLMELAHNPNSGFPCFKVGSKFLINRDLLIAWLDKITKEGRVL